jgi:osmoprotectant transport system permease protein
VSPLPLQDRILEHLLYTVIAVGIASLIALPLGFYIGHTGRGRQFVIGFTGAVRALPTLGVLFFLTMILGSVVRGQSGVFWGTMIALIVLAIPPILAGAYAGLEAVSRQVIDAARASGMTEMQILTRVEIPLAMPLIVGGLRSGVLQVIATAVIASYAGLGGLGRVIASGIGLNDYDRILGGAILVTVLALVVDGAFAVVQRLTRPPGAARDTSTTHRHRAGASRPDAAGESTPERKITA